MCSARTKPESKVFQFPYFWFLRSSKMRFFLVVATLMLVPLQAQLHPFYVGVTELELATDSGQLGLSIRLFTDDLEDALKRSDKSGTAVDLIRGSKNDEVNRRLEEYLHARMRVLLNGTAPELKYLGYEIELDACWVYFEGKRAGKLRQLQLTNRALFDFLPEQQHVVHITVDGKRRSGKLVNPEDTYKIDWKEASAE